MANGIFDRSKLLFLFTILGGLFLLFILPAIQTSHVFAQFPGLPAIQGTTSYTDGTTTKSGPSGTSITARATGAVPGRVYLLVSGKNNCATDIVPINTTSVTANSSGAIAEVSGPIERTEGSWNVCFLYREGGIPISATSIMNFTIGTAVASPTPSPTPILSVSLTQSPSATPVPCNGAMGDANCDGLINSADYIIWRSEFIGTATTKLSDFNDDQKVDAIDFELWRRASRAEVPVSSPTATPTPTPGLGVPTPTPTPIAPTATPTPPTASVTPDGEVIPPGCTITGTSASEPLIGTAGDDVICGFGGSDQLIGMEGNDTIYGGSGSDQIVGMAGDDTLRAQDGEIDVVIGREGNDTCQADSNDVVLECEN